VGAEPTTSRGDKAQAKQAEAPLSRYRSLWGPEGNCGRALLLASQDWIPSALRISDEPVPCMELARPGGR